RLLFCRRPPWHGDPRPGLRSHRMAGLCRRNWAFARRRCRSCPSPENAPRQSNTTHRRVTMNRLWRGIAIFVLGGVHGTGFGLAPGFFFFPYVFPPPPATEQLAEAERSMLVAAGTFIHANPSDPVHYGKGKVSVYERSVFLEPDFEVGPGPAFHVYLVP